MFALEVSYKEWPRPGYTFQYSRQPTLKIFGSYSNHACVPTLTLTEPSEIFGN
jgi:hypothetical protein